MEVAHFVFGIFGNATALFLFLSPIITFQRVLRKRTTEDFSGVPYNMTMLNCLLSAWYGLPFVSPNNMLVWTINGTGALIEAIYVLIFLIYAPKKAKVRMFGLLTLVSFVFATVALISILVLHGHTRKLFCGFAATIFSICMYASPLSIMRLVIKTKSVEFMPFFLSLFVFLCGTSWFIYGLLGRDPFITVQIANMTFQPLHLQNGIVGTHWRCLQMNVAGAEWLWLRARCYAAYIVRNLQEE
ncbi:Bidirectional sugar transporter SWEET1a [Apostasia shenzhenica]|uniref:Bidirectional sugar transporter SWEET n=1 Tax=Apostasia shenzhenica TaxID=1088818 RepID=A0A2I0AI41_9ASPA|nr:Bidirectional sugar transporter SWEET1a [Apostasia shenzhenica]